VVGSLIQLFCRVTKFGWLDDDRFKDVIKEAMNFLSQVMTFSFNPFTSKKSIPLSYTSCGIFVFSMCY
jgi:hypothetical protein